MTVLTESFPGTSGTFGGDLTWDMGGGDGDNVSGQGVWISTGGYATMVTTPLSTDDQYAKMIVPNGFNMSGHGVQAGFYLRGNAAPMTVSGYGCDWIQNRCRFTRIASGSWSEISVSSTGIFLNDNDEVYAEIVGYTLTFKINGSTVHSYTDTAGNKVASGKYVGIDHYYESAGAWQPKYDNFEAGDIGGLNNYTLACDGGSYAITGSALTLRAARTLSLGSGSYAITGSNLTLKAARLLSLGGGSYVITGASLNLIKSIIASLATGSYSISGSNLNLKADRKLVLDSGSYSLSGSALSLKATRVLGLGGGTYIITGTDLSMKAARRIAALAGSYIITGGDVNLVYSGAVIPPEVASAEVGLYESIYAALIAKWSDG